MKPIHRLAVIDALKGYEHTAVVFRDATYGTISLRVFNVDGSHQPSLTLEAVRSTPHPKKHLWIDGVESTKKSCSTLREAMTWLQIPYEDGSLPPDA